MRSEKGRSLHEQSEFARESGEFEKAVQLANEAIDAYEKDGDFLGQSDACGSLSLAYRHLGNLDKAEKAALKGIRIAEEKNLGGDLARPYFNLAKVQEQKGEFKTAVETYRKSINVFQEENPTLHNRSGVLADMKIHLYTCEYKTGDKNALGRAIGALEELDKSDEKDVSKYNYCVWMSGGYMRMAEILRVDNPQMAHQYLEDAKKMIDENIQALPDLKIRLGQWEKLAKDFS